MVIEVKYNIGDFLYIINKQQLDGGETYTVDVDPIKDIDVHFKEKPCGVGYRTKFGRYYREERIDNISNAYSNIDLAMIALKELIEEEKHI